MFSSLQRETTYEQSLSLVVTSHRDEKFKMPETHPISEVNTLKEKKIKEF